MPATSNELTLLHTRKYDTEVYKVDDTRIRAVGTVRDTKPAGMYIEDDPEPLTIHDMRLVIEVDIASLTIADTWLEFEAHPNDECPGIVDHYRQLIGLSVSRGFNRKVRELFGGPRGCTHTTALLQAMGPVIVQSMWSLRMLDKQARGLRPFEIDPQQGEGDGALANLNTCHVWAEDGPLVAQVRAGEWGDSVPVWIRRRLPELGRDLDQWRIENGRG